MKPARLLHTMLRVGNLQRSVDFYTRIMSMKVLRTFERPDEKYTLVFVGCGDDSDTCVLELTYNQGVSEHETGNVYGHVAVGVDDCARACEYISSKGARIIYGPEPLEETGEIIAFTEDPDCYRIELIEHAVSP